jgi:hypothetical protein
MIGNQVDAFKELALWFGKSKDSPPLQDIIIAAQKKWPDDYQMQVYTIKNQVEAYIEINK